MCWQCNINEKKNSEIAVHEITIKKLENYMKKRSKNDFSFFINCRRFGKSWRTDENQRGSPESVHFGDFSLEEFDEYEISQDAMGDEDGELEQEEHRNDALYYYVQIVLMVVL